MMSEIDYFVKWDQILAFSVSTTLPFCITSLYSPGGNGVGGAGWGYVCVQPWGGGGTWK